ncbi:MAG TPA: hypothetical protein VF006_27265 [Longimicrobium sp.]
MSSIRAILLLTGAGGLAACGGGSTPLSSPDAPACTAAASVSLAQGQTRALTAVEAACFSLVGADGAEYALAGYDARMLLASRAGQLTGALGDPRYTIVDATHGSRQSLAIASGAPAERARPTDLGVRLSGAVDPAEPFARQMPWREGERFMVKPIEGSAPVQARVVRVVSGRFVLAVVEGDESGAGRVMEQALEALQFLARDGVAVLQATFSASIPSTSAGAGQLLVLAAAWDPSKGAGATWTREDENGTHSFVWLNLNLRPGRGDGYEMYDHASYRVSVLGHELTHAWQAEWLGEADGPARPSFAAAPRWSVEGGADFVAMDLVRRFLNVGANWKWSENLDPSKAGVIFALEPFDARGRLTWGYYDASSLLRDLQSRLVAAGMPREAAMAEVSRGAVEGWYGADGEGGASAGLVGRMRARLGAAWDPAAAVLLWTASQAADDQTSSTALANPTYYGVGGDGRYGWKPAAEVRAGSGQGAAVTQVAGGSFYVRIKGARDGSVLSAVGSTPDARWMIARVR